MMMLYRVNKGGLTLDGDSNTVNRDFIWPGHVWFEHDEQKWAWSGWHTPTMYYDTLEQLLSDRCGYDLRNLPCNWDVDRKVGK